MISSKSFTAVRISFAVILLIVALNAFGGGYYGMTGAKEVPVEWLHDTLFTSYFLPGLFLFVVVGGACLVNSIGAFLNKKWAAALGVFSGLLLICWIIVQWFIIGLVSWLQPAVFVLGLVVLILTMIMKNLRTQTG